MFLDTAADLVRSLLNYKVFVIDQASRRVKILGSTAASGGAVHAADCPSLTMAETVVVACHIC
jgi:hypothetical protein